ncbi:MAG: AAA family ATPase [Candidatus Neomarinimicrobiota bacterium]
MIGLRREPFSTSPDPEYLYLSEQHKECLDRLEISVRLRRGLSVIMGSVGTGKTSLSRKLIRTFQSDGKYDFYLILDPKFDSEFEFLGHLIDLFQVESRGNSVLECKDILENFFLKRGLDEDRIIVLIIDEGQNLTPEYLEALRTLLNFETDEFKLLQLVIFAQQEFRKLLKEYKNFGDRVSTGYVLNPVNKKETRELIEFRLVKSGYEGNPKLFTQGAIEQIYNYTQGYPRRIITLCHNLLVEMIMSQSKSVGKSLVVSAIRKERTWNA